ncbi:MAG: glycosyltransferase [Saprospiraceae bacterium]|nr:glycosyltransferase [Saprospiraceae bacterium]
MGHQVCYFVKKGSVCDFAPLVELDETRSIISQIEGPFDVLHFHFTPDDIDKLQNPFVITIHGNSSNQDVLNINSIFVSADHAQRHSSDSFVYNGLDWSEYTKPNLSIQRKYFHFLGNAAWRVKNVKGAINTILRTKTEQLKVLGGVRFNFRMGIRFTLSKKVQFYGMVGGYQKDQLVNASKGLIFPVRWHEPFGLAVIESLYYGCPVFGTPYGALPELVHPDVGYLSNVESDMVDALLHAGNFDPKVCHEYAASEFNSHKMAKNYLEKYGLVLAGKALNPTAPHLKQIPAQKFLDWNIE